MGLGDGWTALRVAGKRVFTRHSYISASSTEMAGCLKCSTVVFDRDRASKTATIPGGVSIGARTSVSPVHLQMHAFSIVNRSDVTVIEPHRERRHPQGLWDTFLSQCLISKNIDRECHLNKETDRETQGSVLVSSTCIAPSPKKPKA